MSSLKKMIIKVENESHEFMPSIVHGLLEICMTLTGRGDVGDDYIQAIEFNIGDISIFSNPYYNQVSIFDEDDVEAVLDDNEMNKLADELKKRILSFDRKIRSKRKEVTEKVFDEPVDLISFQE